jgi:hypothetical protein
MPILIAREEPMPVNQSLDHYIRAFNERFAVFRNQKIDKLVLQMVDNDIPAKVDACKKAHTALVDLQNMLSEPDRPAWLSALSQGLSGVIANPADQGSVRNMINCLVSNIPLIKAQKWDFTADAGGEPVNFDDVYRKYYDQSRIPELFEEMIAKLQEIVDSDEVDSVRALRSLEKLIATIKKNIKGSYFSTVQTWGFASAFIRNSLWELLSDLPIAGSVVKGLKATLDEVDAEMADLQGRMKADLDSQTKQDLPALEFKPKPTLALPSADDDTSPGSGESA